MKTRPTFEQAKAMYVHRYTMEHVPEWAKHTPRDDGGTADWYYAPHYRTDREWYDNTLFPGEAGYPFGKRETHCYTTGETWPLGQKLSAPFQRNKAA